MANKPNSYVGTVDVDDISIAQLWTLFSAHVISASAPAMQREEMRKAFYAGFCECFKFFTDVSQELPVEQAVGILDRVNKEAHEFFVRMMKEHPVR